MPSDTFSNGANDWDSFPSSEPGNEIVGQGKEKEKETKIEPTTTATGEDQEWANFDF